MNDKKKYLTEADKVLAGILDDPVTDVPEVPSAMLTADGYVDPAKLKQEFLLRSYPLMLTMINAATGQEELVGHNRAQAEVWDLFKEIIKTTDNVTPTISLEGKTTQEKIETVFTSVSNGLISQAQAKNYMDLITKGFDTLELSDMMEQIEELQSND